MLPRARSAARRATSRSIGGTARRDGPPSRPLCAKVSSTRRAGWLKPPPTVRVGREARVAPSSAPLPASPHTAYASSSQPARPLPRRCPSQARTTPLTSSKRCSAGRSSSSSTRASTTEVRPRRAPSASACVRSVGRDPISTGVLACLDGYMNIVMEQTEEYVNGQLKAKYGDTFIRGNNGTSRPTAAPSAPTPTRRATGCPPRSCPAAVLYISTQKAKK